MKDKITKLQNRLIELLISKGWNYENVNDKMWSFIWWDEELLEKFLNFLSKKGT